MNLEQLIFFTLTIATTLACVWALIDAALRPAPAFEAAGKLDKTKWLLILGAALVVGNLIPFLGLAGLVAVIVYFVDVRPAVREVQAGGRWN